MKTAASLVSTHGGTTTAIKLFGQTIPLPPPPLHTTLKEEETHLDEDEVSLNSRSDRTTTPSRSTSSDTPAEHKRPDKIIPCPRCKSMETKFCYFNNYNVNQPRHFCKGCQRYWTAGGALRNVPIGAGRRKLKPMMPVAGSEGQVFLGGFSAESEGFDFDRAVLEEYYWANHHHQQRRVMESSGFCEDFPEAKRRKNESAATTTSTTTTNQLINC